ncbi:hypothetical protein ACC781_38505, partial [Rhizobium ruizarguesonis]
CRFKGGQSFDLLVTCDLGLSQMELVSPQRLCFHPETYSPEFPAFETRTVGIAAKLREENFVISEVRLCSLTIAEHSVR